MSNFPRVVWGVPTEPDVKKIRAAYPDTKLSPGVKIPYQDIAKLLNIPVHASRFRTVTAAWRKVVENETNFIIGTLPGMAFVVLSEAEKVDLSGTKLRSAARSARRSFEVASRIDVVQLSTQDRARLEHQNQVSSKIIAAAQLRKKQKNLPII